jgi:hypothetical protein
MSVLGIIRLFQDGTEINIKPGGSLKLGGVTDQPVIYGTQVGFAGKMEQSEVDVKAVITTGMNVLATFPNGVDHSIQVECDTGQTFVWDIMRRTGTLDLTAGDNSEVALKYIADLHRPCSGRFGARRNTAGAERSSAAAGFAGACGAE